jgi:hypothetical protein
LKPKIIERKGIMSKKCENCSWGEIVYKNVDFVTTPGGYRDTQCHHPEKHHYCTTQSAGPDAIDKYEEGEVKW